MFATLYTDGASRGNPGPAGAGALLLDQNQNILGQVSSYLGESSNNVAEYQALILGLEKGLELKISEIEVKMDSQLIVRQIMGQYRVKKAHLIPLFQKASKLAKKFNRFSIAHIPREQNQEADRLANLALDKPIEKNGRTT